MFGGVYQLVLCNVYVSHYLLFYIATCQCEIAPVPGSNNAVAGSGTPDPILIGQLPLVKCLSLPRGVKDFFSVTSNIHNYSASTAYR